MAMICSSVHIKTERVREPVTQLLVLGSTLRLFLKNKVSVFLLISCSRSSSLLISLCFEPTGPADIQNPETGVHYGNVPPNEKFWFGTITW